MKLATFIFTFFIMSAASASTEYDFAAYQRAIQALRGDGEFKTSEMIGYWQLRYSEVTSYCITEKTYQPEKYQDKAFILAGGNKLINIEITQTGQGHFIFDIPPKAGFFLYGFKGLADQDQQKRTLSIDDRRFAAFLDAEGEVRLAVAFIDDLEKSCQLRIYIFDRL